MIATKEVRQEEEVEEQHRTHLLRLLALDVKFKNLQLNSDYYSLNLS